MNSPLRLLVHLGTPCGGEAALIDDPRVGGQVFGDDVPGGELGAQLPDDFAQVPAVDLGGHVEPEPVGPVLLQVHARSIAYSCTGSGSTQVKPSSLM
jgi:hypothetical protein